METLPSHYTRGTAQLHGGQFHHTRLDDGSQKKALYKVEFQPTNGRIHLVGYEAFLVKIQKPMTMTVGGVTVQYTEKEMKPSDEAFGKWAFQCHTKESAQIKFDELVVLETQYDNDGKEIKRKRGRRPINVKPIIS